MIRVTSNGEEYFLNFQHEKLPEPLAGFKQAELTVAARYRIVMHALETARDMLEPEIFLVKDAAQRAIDAMVFQPQPTHSTVCKVSKVPRATVPGTVRDCALRPEFPVEVTRGHSFTAPGDNFCRQTGRWWSLTRALEHLAAQGLEAGDFAAAYFCRGCGQPRMDEIVAYNHWYAKEYPHANLIAPLAEAA